MRESGPSKESAKSNENISVIVVGVVRDIAKTFTKDFERLKLALSHFENIDWFLVESGSSDNTVQLLEEISRISSNFSFEHLEYNTSLSRTENIALARNAYLKHLQGASLLDSYSYVIMADFNNLNNKITKDAVLTCFNNSEWDVVTANQRGRYYDAWALRHPLWSPSDCWEQHAFFRKYMKFPESAITYSMRSRMIRIPKDSDWIEVESAFGGLAIYKSSTLRAHAEYIGITNKGGPICEHVPFHAALRSNGARIFINPAFINTHTTDHSRRLSVLFTLLRICRYPFNQFLKLNRKV